MPSILSGQAGMSAIPLIPNRTVDIRCYSISSDLECSHLNNNNDGNAFSDLRQRATSGGGFSASYGWAPDWSDLTRRYFP
jgi:hypothetical protein